MRIKLEKQDLESESLSRDIIELEKKIKKNTNFDTVSQNLDFVCDKKKDSCKFSTVFVYFDLFEIK